MLQIPMNETVFDEASKRLSGYGVPIEGRSGEINKEGIRARYEYDGEKLTIEVLEKPFFLPLDMIEGRLAKYFGGLGVTEVANAPEGEAPPSEG